MTKPRETLRIRAYRAEEGDPIAQVYWSVHLGNQHVTGGGGKGPTHPDPSIAQWSTWLRAVTKRDEAMTDWRVYWGSGTLVSVTEAEIVIDVPASRRGE